MPENSSLSGIRIFEAPRGETGFRAGLPVGAQMLSWGSASLCLSVLCLLPELHFQAGLPPEAARCQPHLQPASWKILVQWKGGSHPPMMSPFFLAWLDLVFVAEWIAEMGECRILSGQFYVPLPIFGKCWVFKGCQVRGRGGGCWVIRVTDANLNLDDSLCFPPFLHFVILHLLWNAIDSFIS